jgi:hypothetical protein
MWGLLSDPGHADSFDDFGEEYEPIRHLVEQLSQREYAGHVYAFKSMYTFNLTTAPTYQQADGHDDVGLGYNPRNGLFGVSYSEWVSPTRNPRHRTVASRVCERHEVGQIVDRYVLRLLLSCQHVDAEPYTAPDGDERS